MLEGSGNRGPRSASTRSDWNADNKWFICLQKPFLVNPGFKILISQPLDDFAFLLFASTNNFCTQFDEASADHESVYFGGPISGCGKCGISNFCFIVVVVVSCKTMNSWHQKFMQAERKKNFAVKFLFYWFENCLHAFLITDFVLLREYFNMYEYIRRVYIYNSSFWSPSLTRSAVSRFIFAFQSAYDRRRVRLIASKSE